MYVENSVYPKRQIGYAFKPHVRDMFVNDFNNKTFNQDCIESAIFKIKCYNPSNLKFQHLAVKEKTKN